MTSNGRAASSQAYSHASSSQSNFWAEAVVAAQELEPSLPSSPPPPRPPSPPLSAPPHQSQPHSALPQSKTSAATPLQSSARFRSLLVSPDTSDIEPDPVAELEAEDEHGHHEANNDPGQRTGAPTVHFCLGDNDRNSSLPPSSPPPSSPPPSPPAVTTELTFLPQQRDATGDHAYLSRPEYAANTFGDIGAYMRNKDIKVQTQNAQIAANAAALGLAQIFTNLTFYINGNTSPPMEVLRRMILERGGKVVPFVRRKTEIDYVIAPVLTIAKFREWQNIKIVKERFVIECCRANKVVDWRRWRLRPDGEGPVDIFAPPPRPKEREQDTKDKGKEREVGKVILDESNPFRTPALPETITKTGGRISLGDKAVKFSPMETLTKHVLSQSTPVAATRSLLPPLYSTPRPSQVPRSQVIPSQQLHATPVPTKPVASRPLDSAPKPEVRKHAPTNIYTSTTTATAATTDTTSNVTKADTKNTEGAWDNYFVHKSNKQAAHLMKSDTFRARHTSERGNDAGFIDQYYQNSRLHHLSTWKAELRVLVAEARASAISHVPTVLPLPGEEPVYFHVDFDAFFVAAGLSSRPHLRGRPVVVCHSSAGGKDSTSEVASASYEARAKGVRNGMSLGRARQLVGADLETIPYEFETYKRHSAQFYTILLTYADELEAVSVDEALLDVSGAVRARALAPLEAGAASDDLAIQLAEKIRDDIRAATGCEVSIGISHNILLARLATKKAKPAGVFRLSAAGAPSFLAELDVDQLPSIGYSLRSKISDAFGSTSCGVLVSQPKSALQRVLGPKIGETVFSFLRGIDTRRLQPDKERRSVSAEMNYGIRFQSSDQAEKYVRDLSAEVAKRLRNIGAKGRHMTLKIMVRHPDAPVEPPKFLGHGRCETVNKGGPLRALSDNEGVIGDEAVRLLQSMRLDPTELRGVGIMITKLVIGPGKGQSLLDFGKRNEEKEKERTEDVAVWIEASQDEEGKEHERDTAPVTPGVVPRNDLASTSLLNTRLIPEPAVIPAPPVPGTPAVSATPGIDPDFLAALPPTLRREVEEDHTAQRAAKRRRTEQTGLELDPVPARAALNPAAHITRQLRPKLKTQMAAKDIANLPLYGAWSRADARPSGPVAGPSRAVDTEPTELSDSDIEVISESPSKIGGVPVSELRSLGIDVDVFAELPPDVRSEVVQSERERIARQRAREARDARASASPRRGRHRQGSRSRAGSHAPQPVVAAVVSRPSLFGARSTDDVRDILMRWVGSRPIPAEPDVLRVGSYLAKCVTQGMGGVEHVSELLRAVRGLLSDLEIGNRRGDEALQDVEAWWAAWHALKAAVDDVLVQRMGAGLRL